MLSRRTVLSGLGVAGLAVATEAVPRASVAVSGASADPVFTFASLPDFFNGDVADLSGLPTWDRGPNSINAPWRAAIDTCLGAVKAHQPDAVFVAGDLVQGHWNMDTSGRELFGPVSQGIDRDSIAQCKDAIQMAGDVHYGFYRDMFAEHGLDLYPAVGDHEILDDRAAPMNHRWPPGGFLQGGRPDNRYYLVDKSKDVWAQTFTRPAGLPRYRRRPIGTSAEWTAYAVSFADALTLITVDVFTKRADGVHLGVFNDQTGLGQLTWLRDEIRRAKRRGHIVVVQGHVPTMMPTRTLYSGKLHLPEGRRSTFYQTIAREGVDLYLCGEVHDSTAIQHGRLAPLQISHGCIFQNAFPFLVGRVHADGRLVLDLYEMLITEASAERDLWCSSTTRNQRTFIEYGAPRHRGRIVQRRREVVLATQKFGHYRPLNDPLSLAGHLGTTVV